MGRRKIITPNYDDPRSIHRKFKWASDDVVFTNDPNGVYVMGRAIGRDYPGYDSQSGSVPITDDVRSSCTQRALDAGRFNVRYFGAEGGGDPEKEFDYIPEDTVVTAHPSRAFLRII
jgi:hypothetical protein